MKKLYVKEIELEELNSTPLWVTTSIAGGAGIAVGFTTFIIVT
ncbi:hypothetical protein ACT7C1_06110 [Bacillus paranthracis]